MVVPYKLFRVLVWVVASAWEFAVLVPMLLGSLGLDMDAMGHF